MSAFARIDDNHAVDPRRVLGISKAISGSDIYIYVYTDGGVAYPMGPYGPTDGSRKFNEVVSILEAHRND